MERSEKSIFGASAHLSRHTTALQYSTFKSSISGLQGFRGKPGALNLCCEGLATQDGTVAFRVYALAARVRFSLLILLNQSLNHGKAVQCMEVSVASPLQGSGFSSERVDVADSRFRHAGRLQCLRRLRAQGVGAQPRGLERLGINYTQTAQVQL